MLLSARSRAFIPERMESFFSKEYFRKESKSNTEVCFGDVSAKSYCVLMSLIWRANWQEKRLSQFGVKMPVYVDKSSLKHYHTSDECSLSTTKLSTSGFAP